MSDELSLDQVADSVFAAQESAAPPEPTASDPTAAVDPAAGATPQPDAASPTPTPASLADDTVVEVLVDGKLTPMSLGEAKKGFMMHAAFTKKTQTLAEERKQAAYEREQIATERQQLAAQQQQVMQVLRDPAKLSAVYLALQSQQQQGFVAPPQAPQPQFDPFQFKQQIVSEALETIHYKQQEAAIESDVTTFTSGLIADDPILSIVPGFIDRVYEDVSKMGPTNTDEAKAFIQNYIDDTKAKLSGVSTNAAKTQAAAKAKVIANGTIPGGAPVTPAAKDYANFNDMEADMLAFLK